MSNKLSEQTYRHMQELGIRIERDQLDRLPDSARKELLVQDLSGELQNGQLDKAEATAQLLGRELTEIELALVLGCAVAQGRTADAQAAAALLRRQLTAAEIDLLFFRLVEQSKYDAARAFLGSQPEARRLEIAGAGVDMLLEQVAWNQAFTVVETFIDESRRAPLYEKIFEQAVRLGDLGRASKVAENLGRTLTTDQIESIIRENCDLGLHEHALRAVACLPQGMRTAQLEYVLDRVRISRREDRDAVARGIASRLLSSD